MTFILGIMSLLTLNTFFVSIGGGYRKFPNQGDDDVEQEKKDSRVLLD